MAIKPLTTESVALTEKKMDMTLDDIIKMTKTNVFKPKTQRVPNKSSKFARNNAQEKSAKVKRFMDSRSSLRQGALAQKRSNYQGNQFPLAKEAARKAAIVSTSNKAFNQRRGFKANQMRIAGPAGQRKSGYGSFTVKSQGNPVQNQRTQTLDSLFSNLKEQRMRALSQHNNSNGGRQNGGGSQRQQRQGRWWFGNN